jgi:hypothetical protein
MLYTWQDFGVKRVDIRAMMPSRPERESVLFIGTQFSNHKCVFIKLFGWGRGIVRTCVTRDDGRTQVCVDSSAHHAIVNVGVESVCVCVYYCRT